MTVSVEHVEGLRYRATTQIPAADVEAAFERELRRVGEIGESLEDVRQRVGDEAWEQALENARWQAYYSAIRQSGLRAVGEPELEWVRRARGEDCVFTATVEVFPNIDLSALQELEIEEPVTEITEADVDRAVELLRSEHRTFSNVQRPARTGDRVMFDFQGFVDGEPFEGSSGDGAAATLGAGDVLEDVETALAGRSADESFEADIVFPEDYAERSLRGRTARFRMHVRSVAEPEFPDLGPEFIRQLGVKSGSVEDLRGMLRERLEAECDRKRERYEREQITERLLEAIPVEVPETLLHYETQRMRETFKQQNADAQRGAEAEQDALPEEPLRATAERRVALSLILSEVIRQHDIRLDQKRVDRKLDELVARFGQSEETKRRYRENQQIMHSVQALVTEEEGFEEAMRNVRRKRVPMSFDALLSAFHGDSGRSAA
ncbi:MAG TPA: trigger factor [Gammaproteobacteria bacterium]|nr:trigger factor [Gammaproteobacteria bacterium]